MKEKGLNSNRNKREKNAHSNHLKFCEKNFKDIEIRVMTSSASGIEC
jgi:hypothetical protein